MLILNDELYAPINNVCRMEYFMKKNSYELMLRVYDKQRRGERLFQNEKRWKKNYNKSREEFCNVVEGIKITRYKPAWQS